MVHEDARPPSGADEQLIDACIELLDAGRPVSDIIAEMKRRSAEAQPRLDPNTTVISITEEGRGVGRSQTEGRGEKQVADPEASATPVRVQEKSRRIWMAIATISLIFGTAIGAAMFRPRLEPQTSAVAPAPTLTTHETMDATAPNPQRPTLTAAQIGALVERGTALVGSGDLSAARLYFEPAVNAGDAQAAIYLGQTYDPFFLKRGRFGKSVKGDAKMAEYWYRRARQLGSNKAEEMLQSVANSSAK